MKNLLIAVMLLASWAANAQTIPRTGPGGTISAADMQLVVNQLNAAIAAHPGISTAVVSATNHLLIVRTDGTTIDAGLLNGVATASGGTVYTGIGPVVVSGSTITLAAPPGVTPSATLAKAAFTGLYGDLSGLPGVASTTAPGLSPILPNNATLFLNGVGVFAAPPSGSGTSGVSSVNNRQGPVVLTLSDIPGAAGTALASTTAPGLAPARSGTAGTYLDGTGVYSTPPNGSFAQLAVEYSQSGPIDPAATEVTIKATSPVTMSLTLGTVDKKPMYIKNFGTALATITGPIDMATRSIPLNPPTAPTSTNVGLGDGVLLTNRTDYSTYEAK